MTESAPHDDPPRAAPDTGLRASAALLRRNPEFRRLFIAALISMGGDWFLFVAIASLVLDATGRAIFVGVLILSQSLPMFVASPFAGVLADRVDRRRLMIGSDLIRAVICVAFLAVGERTIWLAFPLLALLSIFEAPFDPASTAAIPNLVEPDDLPVANALDGSLWGTMLAVGAALGGVVSAVFGRDTAFIADCVSFVASAVLLSRIRRSFMEPGAHERRAPVDGRGNARDDRVRPNGPAGPGAPRRQAGFGLAAGVLALIPVFAERVFRSGEIGLGMLMACRGVGALVGPFLGHRLAGAGHRRLWGTIAVALTVFGLGYLMLGLAPSIWLAAVTILCAHLGGGAQWVLSTYGLQVIVPDRIRGRIFGFDYAFITLSLALSSLTASWLADAVGPRRAGVVLGTIALAWAGTWWIATRGVRSRRFEAAPAQAEPAFRPVDLPGI